MSDGSKKVVPSSSSATAVPETEEDSYLELFRARLAAEPEEPSKFEVHGQDIFLCLKSIQRKQQTGKIAPISRLFPYQIDAVLKIKEHFDNPENIDANGHFRKALIVAPPGSGKSGMVTLIPYVLKCKKVFILTPSSIISNQLAADFGKVEDSALGTTSPFFRKCGLFLDDREIRKVSETCHVLDQSQIKSMADYNLVILNAQKFCGNANNSISLTARTAENRQRVRDQFAKFDTIIVDEAHHYPAPTWETLVELFNDKKVIFLTATPFRGEKHLASLGHQVDIVAEIAHQELEGKTIRRVEFIERSAVSTSLDPPFLEQLKTDIDESLDSHKDQEPRALNPQAMILVQSQEEVKLVAAALGNQATYLISKMPIKEAKVNFNDFTQQRKKYMVVCGMLKEGYDNQNVSLVVILRKVRARVFFEQFCGRCTRMHRNLTGVRPDRTRGTVLSYGHFEQSKMWAARTQLAIRDPEEEEDEEGDN